METPKKKSAEKFVKDIRKHTRRIFIARPRRIFFDDLQGWRTRINN